MIGERLAALRNERKLTMKEIGEILDITDSTWNKYEKNRITPSYDVLLKIAEFFNVSIDFLAGVTNIRNYDLIQKTEITEELLKKIEGSTTSDPSEMYFILENLTMALEAYTFGKADYNAIDIFLKVVSDVIIYFNDLTEMKNSDNSSNDDILDYHNRALADILRKLNKIFFITIKGDQL